MLRNHNGCLIWKNHIQDIEDGFEEPNKSSPFGPYNMANLEEGEHICKAGPHPCC